MLYSTLSSMVQSKWLYPASPTTKKEAHHLGFDYILPINLLGDFNSCWFQVKPRITLLLRMFRLLELLST